MSKNIKNRPKIDPEMEAVLKAVYSQEADPRFGKLLGERLREKATAMHLEKTLSGMSADRAKKAKAGGLSMLFKWQFAFLSAIIAVLVIGGGTVMAVPSLREKFLQAVKPRATVSITSNPEGAEVWVGPVLYGETPLDFRLAEGEHELTVKKEGFADVTETIQLESGKRTDLEAVLVENENTMKYTRDETWNLYQDPENAYSAWFPYDWDYDWEPFSEGDFASTTVTFNGGETLFAKIYFQPEAGQPLADTLKEQLECESQCSFTTDTAAFGEQILTGDKLVGTSKETGRATTYFIVDITRIGYTGSMVLESNSIWADKFIDKLKISSSSNRYLELTEYRNDTYGFGFGYPEGSGWELYELTDKTFAQVSAVDGLFSVTIGGINTDADNSVKNEEILITVGEEVYPAVRRYYEGTDEYVVQGNITVNSTVYGIEYMYTDDKWTNELNQILKSVWLSPTEAGNGDLPSAEYYMAENVLAVTDVVYPDDQLRCGDGVMITGKIYESDENGTKGNPPSDVPISIKITKNGNETDLPTKVISTGDTFTVPSALLRYQLFSPLDNTCGLDNVTVALVAGTSGRAIWSKEYSNMSKERIATTGVEGIVTSFGTGVAYYSVSVFQGDTLITSTDTGQGGYFIFPLEPGNYRLIAGASSAEVYVTSNVLSYASINLQDITIDSEGSGIGSDEPEPVRGTVQGVVHSDTAFMANTRIELYRNNRYAGSTRTDSSGRFKFESLTPGNAYDIRIPTKTILLARWEITVGGIHILPDGGTLIVDVIVE